MTHYPHTPPSHAATQKSNSKIKTTERLLWNEREQIEVDGAAGGTWALTAAIVGTTVSTARCLVFQVTFLTGESAAHVFLSCNETWVVLQSVLTVSGRRNLTLVHVLINVKLVQMCWPGVTHVNVDQCFPIIVCHFLSHVFVTNYCLVFCDFQF